MQTLATLLAVKWLLSLFGFDEAFRETRCAPIEGTDSVVVYFRSESNDGRRIAFMGSTQAFAFNSNYSKGILDWRNTKRVRLTAHRANQTLMTIEYQQESNSSLRTFEAGYLTDACRQLLVGRYGNRLNFIHSDRMGE